MATVMPNDPLVGFAKGNSNMRTKKVIFYLGFILIGAIGGIVASVTVASSNSLPIASSSSLSLAQATPPPTPTPGAPPPRPAATWVPLDEPISTEVEALEMALYYDSVWISHEEPWDVNTWRTDPGRIDVREYANLAEVAQERLDTGKSAGFLGPDAGAPDAGGVWLITIKGKLQIGLARTGDTFESVTYIISKRTGNLLSITGEFVE
jgi:hypothetical protein